jgi:hypothetical protein
MTERNRCKKVENEVENGIENEVQKSYRKKSYYKCMDQGRIKCCMIHPKLSLVMLRCDTDKQQHLITCAQLRSTVGLSVEN